MTTYFSDEFEPRPSRALDLENQIYSLGIRPELLADLTVDDARFVLNGVAKLLATITHTDRGRNNLVLGQDIASINGASASIQSANDQDLTQALEALSDTSASSHEYRERQRLTSIVEAVTARNRQLANDLLRPERELDRLTGRIAIKVFSDDTTGIYPKTELLYLNLADGVIVEDYFIKGQAKLVGSMSKTARTFLEQQRPNLDDDSRLIYLDEKTANKARLSKNSWYDLVTAKGVNNPVEKRAAVIIYDPSGEQAEEAGLTNCKIFGTYRSPVGYSDSGGWPSLETATKVFGSTINSSVAHISVSQTEELLAQGFIDPIFTAQEALDATHLVLKKNTESSSYIVPGPQTIIV